MKETAKQDAKIICLGGWKDGVKVGKTPGNWELFLDLGDLLLKGRGWPQWESWPVLHESICGQKRKQVLSWWFLFFSVT